jgi:two-component system sensor histidine kinase KdpD
VDMKKNKTVLPHLLYTIGLLLLALAIALFMQWLKAGRESVIMVFLLGVLMTVIFTRGYLYGIVSSIASIMLFNFFFTEPLYTLVISSTEDVLLLVFFEITAIVIGTMTMRLREQKEIASENEQTARLLAEISAGFTHLTDDKNILMQGVAYIQNYTGLECTISLKSKQSKLDLQPESDQERPIKQYPITGSNQEIGALSVVHPQGEISRLNELIIQTVATQIGIALEREYIYNEREKIRVAMEREKLRSTLLRSVAHDLRSPLTALSGASILLSDSFDQLSVEEQKQLASDISEEIVWLANLVENILNMTRISESQLVMHQVHEVVDDVVGEAVQHMKRLLRDRQFEVSLPPDVLTIPMDGRLIVQVLINLLDNAIKHTRPEDKIHLSVGQIENHVQFAVEDEGEGIDPNIRNHLFEGFVTSDRGGISDGKRGIGLGLAICKTIVLAHGGKIRAESNHPKGSRFVFSLPMEEQNGRKK